MAETEMVKRVARALRDADAIWAARKYADYPPEEIQRLIRESADECGYDELAYAAIEAMRQPTDAMQVAGGLKCESILFEDNDEGTGVIFKDMGIVFMTMIDAALSPPSKD